MAKELEQNLLEYNRKSGNGDQDRDRLIALRMEQNDALVELLKKHKRTMLFMQGKPYEKEHHSAETVLLPAAGLLGG